MIIHKKFKTLTFSIMTIIGFSVCGNFALAEKTTQKASSVIQNKKNKAIKNKASVEVKKDDSQTSQNSSFNPLFIQPIQVSPLNSIYLVGRDSNIAGAMDYSRQAYTTRLNALKQLDQDFKLQPRGSAQAQNIADTIFKNYLEQTYYLENIKSFSQYEPKYRDLDHQLKVSHSALVNYIDNILRQFPKHQMANKWKAASLISRLKIGDPSSINESLNYIKTVKTGDSVRIKLVGIAVDYARNNGRSVFGTIDDALDLPMDIASKATFLLLQAEKIDANKQSANAIKAYEETAKLGQSVRSSDGTPSLFVMRASTRIAEIAYQKNYQVPDRDVIQVLQSLNAFAVAHYYVEKIALKNISNNPRQSITYYSDIQNIGGITPQVNLNIEHRMLDIALFTNDAPGIESQWQRVVKLPGALSVAGTDVRINTTQTLNWRNVEKNPTPDSVERYVRMHDMFSSLSPQYMAIDNWSIKSVDALFRLKKWKEASERADKLVTASKNPEIILSALRFAARSREKILAINNKPEFDKNKKLQAGNDIVSPYIGNLQKINTLVKGEENEISTYMIPYITHISNISPDYRDKFENAIVKYPTSIYAPKSISYLLEIALTNKDYAYVEKIARLAEAKTITPEKANHKDLRGLIEIAVYEQATKFMNDRQYEVAVKKFIDFQKEFPKSKNAPQALDYSAKCYVSLKKFDLAVAQMELLLKDYSTSPLALENRWQAAEVSKSIGQFLKAAVHYEVFAKTHTNEGNTRKALLKAAEMHISLGRASNAVTDYELAFTQEQNKTNKIKIAKDIADIQIKYGSATAALSALERIATLAGSSNEEIWARSKMIEIYLRQSQDGQAKNVINKTLGMKPQSQEAFKTIAKMKFYLGRIEAKEVKDINPMMDKNLQNSVKNLITKYEKVKGLYISPCEVPGLEYCSVGYYELSKLSEDVAKAIMSVETPPTLDPKEADAVKKLVTEHGDKLVTESRNYAIQAEQALSSGAPDQEWAERIRAWAQTHKGEVDSISPKTSP